MLFVSHRHGGGTTLHVEDMAKRLAEKGCHVLILEANADDRGAATIRNLTLGTNSVYALPGETDALIRDLRAAGIWHIHFHQIMGGERWTALPGQIGCPYDVTIHDYSFYCPRIDLIDESRQYCGEPALAGVRALHRAQSAAPAAAGRIPRTRRDDGVAASAPRLADRARQVFVPSRDVAMRMERHVPGVKIRGAPTPGEAAERRDSPAGIQFRRPRRGDRRDRAA